MSFLGLLRKPKREMTDEDIAALVSGTLKQQSQERAAASGVCPNPACGAPASKQVEAGMGGQAILCGVCGTEYPKGGSS